MYKNNLYLFGQIDAASILHTKDKFGNSAIRLQLNTVMSNEVNQESRDIEPIVFLKGPKNKESLQELISAIRSNKQCFIRILKATLHDFGELKGFDFSDDEKLGEHSAKEHSLSVLNAYLISELPQSSESANECFKTANLQEIFGYQACKGENFKDGFKDYGHFNKASKDNAHENGSELDLSEDDQVNARLWARKHMNDLNYDVIGCQNLGIVFNEAVSLEDGSHSQLTSGQIKESYSNFIDWLNTNQDEYDDFLEELITRLRKEQEQEYEWEQDGQELLNIHSLRECSNNKSINLNMAHDEKLKSFLNDEALRSCLYQAQESNHTLATNPNASSNHSQVLDKAPCKECNDPSHEQSTQDQDLGQEANLCSGLSTSKSLVKDTNLILDDALLLEPSKGDHNCPSCDSGDANTMSQNLVACQVTDDCSLQDKEQSLATEPDKLPSPCQGDSQDISQGNKPASEQRVSLKDWLKCRDNAKRKSLKEQVKQDKAIQELAGAYKEEDVGSLYFELGLAPGYYCKIFEISNEQGQLVSIGDFIKETNKAELNKNKSWSKDFSFLDESDLYLASHEFVCKMNQEAKANRLLLRKANTKCFAYKLVICNCSNSELSFLFKLLKTHSNIPVMVVGKLVPEHFIFATASSEAIVEAQKFAFYQEPELSSLDVVT